MASLYQRKGSRFWWVKSKDPHTGRIRQKPTRFAHADPAQTRMARALRAELEMGEMRVPRGEDHMVWRNWVRPFLEQRHSESPKTLARKLSAWRTMESYLDEKRIPSPLHLDRQHCLDYLTWRKEAGNFRTKKRPIAHNTVLLELKFLGSIVQEAVRREWIKGNPCFRLEIARAIPREKPELTDAQIALLRSEIAAKGQRALHGSTGEQRNAEFLRVSFEIALAQGCRLFETCLDLRDIDTVNMEITFLAKGRERYTAPLNPLLLPLIAELRASGRRFTYECPKMPSLVWFKFMDKLRRRHPDLKPVSFHSLRVSVISRMERAGVPEKVAMTLVNHSSTTVHRRYRRVTRSELGAVWKALSPLVAASAGKRQPRVRVKNPS